MSGSMKKLLPSLLLSLAGGHAVAEPIRSVNVTGASQLSAEVDQVVNRYLGQESEAENIVSLVNAITELYVSNGFVSSGATLSHRNFRDGTVDIEIVEGRLDAIEVTESGRISSRYIESVIRSEVGPVLQVEDLQRAFTRLEQDRTISAVKGRLLPGTQQGESVLLLAVDEADAFSLTLRANNYRSPSLGSEQAEVVLQHINLTGNADELRAAVSTADGIDAASVRYSFPVSAINGRLSAFYSTGDSIVVEEPFNRIDLESEVDAAGIALATTLAESSGSKLTLEVGLERKSSETMLLGLPFDFSPGSVEGESQAAIASIGLQYEQRNRSRAWTARANYRRGLDALGATIIPNAPDGEFDLWQLQFSYAQRLGEKMVWSARLNAQFTGDTLQSFERFALGGHGSIRGFRENQLLRDEAWEFRTQLDVTAFQRDDMRVVIYPFIDAGEGRNANFIPNTTQSVDLSSVGVGVSASFYGFRAMLEWGERLTEENKQGDELQDDGIHVGISYEF